MLKGRRGSCIWKCLGEDRSQKCFLIRCVLGGGPKNMSKSTLSSFDSINIKDVTKINNKIICVYNYSLMQPN